MKILMNCLVTDKAWSSKPPHCSEQLVFSSSFYFFAFRRNNNRKKYKAAFLSRDKPRSLPSR